MNAEDEVMANATSFDSSQIPTISDNIQQDAMQAVSTAILPNLAQSQTAFNSNTANNTLNVYLSTHADSVNKAPVPPITSSTPTTLTARSNRKRRNTRELANLAFSSVSKANANATAIGGTPVESAPVRKSRRAAAERCSALTSLLALSVPHDLELLAQVDQPSAAEERAVRQALRLSANVARRNDQRKSAPPSDRARLCDATSTSGLIPCAPTFYPTADEWACPMTYLRSLEKVGKEHGIIKIIPPKNFPFKSPLASVSPDNLRYQTRIQHIDSLNRGEGFEYGPTMSWAEHQAYGRKFAVEYWKERKLKDAVEVARTEGENNGERRSEIPELQQKIKEKEDGVEHRMDISPNALPPGSVASSNMSLTPHPLPSPTACPASSSTLSALSPSFLSSQRSSLYSTLLSSLSVEDVEREYWRIVDLQQTRIEVLYGSDVDSGDQKNGVCSGFPPVDLSQLYSNRSKREMEFRQFLQTKCASSSLLSASEVESFRRAFLSESPADVSWYLTLLPRLRGSLFSLIPEEISGCVRPYLYFGMMFSSFCWHAEDDWLYSVNFLHEGAPKVWYGVSSHKADKFEKVMKAHVPALFDSSPDLLYALVTQLSPVTVSENHVPVYSIVQHPGEYVFTFPRAFHCGFNTGNNVAEAVNIAPVDWLPFFRESKQRYNKDRKLNVFVYEKMLIQLVKDWLKKWKEKNLRKNITHAPLFEADDFALENEADLLMVKDELKLYVDTETRFRNELLVDGVARKNTFTSSLNPPDNITPTYADFRLRSMMQTNVAGSAKCQNDVANQHTNRAQPVHPTATSTAPPPPTSMRLEATKGLNSPTKSPNPTTPAIGSSSSVSPGGSSAASQTSTTIASCVASTANMPRPQQNQTSASTLPIALMSHAILGRNEPISSAATQSLPPASSSLSVSNFPASSSSGFRSVAPSSPSLPGAVGSSGGSSAFMSSSSVPYFDDEKLRCSICRCVCLISFVSCDYCDKLLCLAHSLPSNFCRCSSAATFGSTPTPASAGDYQHLCMWQSMNMEQLEQLSKQMNDMVTEWLKSKRTRKIQLDNSPNANSLATTQRPHAHVQTMPVGLQLQLHQQQTKPANELPTPAPLPSRYPGAATWAAVSPSAAATAGHVGTAVLNPQPLQSLPAPSLQPTIHTSSVSASPLRKDPAGLTSAVSGVDDSHLNSFLPNFPPFLASPSMPPNSL